LRELGQVLGSQQVLPCLLHRNRSLERLTTLLVEGQNCIMIDSGGVGIGSTCCEPEDLAKFPHPSDSLYFNTGLDSAKDRSGSTYGDIDVRKVYFKIDISQFESSFRTTYYVIRDLWHSDSTWLIHKDSTLPFTSNGRCKVLYIEGIAINAAFKTGKATAASRAGLSSA